MCVVVITVIIPTNINDICDGTYDPFEGNGNHQINQDTQKWWLYVLYNVTYAVTSYFVERGATLYA